MLVKVMETVKGNQLMITMHVNLTSHVVIFWIRLLIVRHHSWLLPKMRSVLPITASTVTMLKNISVAGTIIKKCFNQAKTAPGTFSKPSSEVKGSSPGVKPSYTSIL